MKESSWCALLSKLKLSQLLERRREKLLLLLIALLVTIIILYHHHGVLISGQQKVLFSNKVTKGACLVFCNLSAGILIMCVLIMGLARSGPTGLPTGRGRPQQKEKVVPAQSEYSANTAHHKHKYSRSKIQIQHIMSTYIECGTSQIQVSI